MRGLFDGVRNPEAQIAANGDGARLEALIAPGVMHELGHHSGISSEYLEAIAREADL